MTAFDVFNPLENVVPRFTEEQMILIEEWFDENAKPQLIVNDVPLNVVTIEKIIDFLSQRRFHRRSFHYPTYYEIMLEAENLKAGVTKMLTKDQFIYMLDKWIVEPNIIHELLMAFKIFDTENRNFLETEDLQIIVTNYGDIFNEAETRELLRDANVRGDGNVFYENFVQSLFSVAPELKELKVDYLYENPDEDPSVPPEPVIVKEEPPPPPPPEEPAPAPEEPPPPPPPPPAKPAAKGKKTK